MPLYFYLQSFSLSIGDQAWPAEQSDEADRWPARSILRIGALCSEPNKKVNHGRIVWKI